MFPPMSSKPGLPSPDVASPDVAKDPTAILDSLQQGIDDLRAILTADKQEDGAEEFMPQTNEEVMAGIKPTPKKKGAF